jgi:hypothetical protein
MKRLLFYSLLFCTALTFGQTNPAPSKPPTGLTFIPDYTFKGSLLTGWHPVGQASWQAKDGEITGTVAAGSAGWLMLDKSFQDIAVKVAFKCAPGTETGILLRAEKTDEGIKGLLLSIKDANATLYHVTLDAQGKELTREPLSRVAGVIRVAPKPVAAPAGSGNRGGGGPRRSGGTDLNLPIARPQTEIQPGEWNQVEVFLDANILRAFVNDDSENGGYAGDEFGSYGPVALYVNGGSVSFKDVSYKNERVRYLPKEASSPRFKVQRINDMYYSWSAAAADFNRDGVMDVVAGPYIYWGPDYTRSSEIYLANVFNPAKEFATVNCQYTFDFNGDGWPDVLTGPPNATLYINPKGEEHRWSKYQVIPTAIQSEITLFKDIDGDGKPELIYDMNGALYYAKFDTADPTKPWTQHQVSDSGYGIVHGIGVGDINGDGRMDILNANGWWEQPPAGQNEGLWIYHPVAFGRYGHRSTGEGGSVMAVYDVNGDGLNDVVTSLSAHGFGMAWYEQKRDAKGNITFVEHMINDDYAFKDNAGGVAFSQQHGSTFADIDGDGIPDFIVGKRYWTHLDAFFDPDPYGPPVLYVYRTVRDKKAPGGARFVPELVHNRSGAGSDVMAVDLNKDGKMDIISSTDRGTFIFWNVGKKSPKAVKPALKKTAVKK